MKVYQSLLVKTKKNKLMTLVDMDSHRFQSRLKTLFNWIVSDFSRPDPDGMFYLGSVPSFSLRSSVANI